MSSNSQPPRRKLPQVWRHAMWHPQSGLVVSPFGRTLPSAVVSSPESSRVDDFSKPRLLKDHNIYLAFYPRQPIHQGSLFSVLAISHDDLSNSIVAIEGGNSPTYILDLAVRTRWSNLETPLLEAVHTLYSAHPRNRFFPALSYPRWPHEYGYRTAHKTKDLTLHCAKRSLAAFTMLAAFSTFVLSLWLTEYEDDCLAAAFSVLSKRNGDAFPHVWLQYLQESIVGNFSPGLRPGGFLNPYTTYWSEFLGKFTRASVPIWLLWGKEYSLDNVADPEMHLYFPPAKYIGLAQKRYLTFSNTVLPYQHTYHVEGDDDDICPTSDYPESSELPTGEGSLDAAIGLQSFVVDNADAFVDNTNLDEPPLPAPAIDRIACVEADSGQQIGESWEEFFMRQTDQLRLRMEHSDEKEKQRRESLEQAAKSGPTNKSAVFLWTQDAVIKTFYRRTRVAKELAFFEWKECTPHQRFFWPHQNAWDLCPQLPAYPNGEAPCSDAYPDSDDDEYEYLSTETPSQLAKPMNALVGPMILQAVRDLTMRDAEPEAMTYRHVSGTVLEYLHRRHGFVADLVESWNPHLHMTAKYRLPKTGANLAIKNLLHIPDDPAYPPSIQTSIVDFHNTALGSETSYTDLPAAWDISRHGRVTVDCNMRRIRLQRVTSALGDKTDLYILRPPEGSQDPSPWFIATTSATTVLLVYRSPWTTMYEIGRGLLEYGIPFRTVVEREQQPVRESLRSKTKGLGSRPRGFQPTPEDFSAYESARDDILRSSYGRSIRLLGGIVGRLAAEVVSDYDVLDGPSLVNVEVVGRHGQKDFVDDAVGNQQLDVVSGVYLVEATTSNNSVSHSSLWPKHLTWAVTGLAGDQWLPTAEEWYQGRLSDFREERFKLVSATDWKLSLKRCRPQTSGVCAGSERLAAEFLRKSRRVH